MAVFGTVATALLSALLTLAALDRAVAFFDLDYVPVRGRRNDLRRRDAVESAIASMPASELEALRPVLEGTVAPDADAAAEPYLRIMALVQPRLFADAVLLPPSYDAAWDDVQRDLRRIFAIARGAGARPVLIFAPSVQQVTAAAKPYLESLGFEWDGRTLTDSTFA